MGGERIRKTTAKSRNNTFLSLSRSLLFTSHPVTTMPALTPISQPPHAISPEEHDALTSSTPANFDDIPPVLRWEDEAEISLAVPSWTAWSDAGPGTGGAANGDADDEMDGEAAANGAGGKVRGRLYVTEQ